MVIPQKTIETITADEYLSLERQAEERNEFYQINETTDVVNLENLQFSITLEELYKAIRFTQ